MNNKRKVLGAVGAAVLLANGAAIADQAEANIIVNTEAQEKEYQEVANVAGEFSFHQEAITPSDEIFNIFGTAATGICAKPAFAMDATAEDAVYYVNVSGKVKRNYSATLAQLKENGGVKRVMVCSCATSSALAQSSITGVLVKDMLALAGVEEDANAIAFKSADGYTATLPLQYVLDKEAVLAWQIGDSVNPAGLQVWMPSTAAKYFTRQVAEIELLTADVSVDAPEQRAKISILNTMEETVKAGNALTFSGYADDCGTAIAAVEFSMDGGKTWTTCETANADANRWVCWNFDYVAEVPGTFKLDVRAVTADGTVSPMASSVVFTVE